MYHNIINDQFLLITLLLIACFLLFAPFHVVSAINMRDLQKDNTIVILLCAALAICVIVIAFLSYTIKKLKRNSCGCCNGKQIHSCINPSKSFCQNWIPLNAVFLFYDTAAVVLQINAATANASDQQSQKVMFIKIRCS